MDSWGNSTQLTQHMCYFAAGCSLTPTDCSNLSAFINKTDYLQNFANLSASDCSESYASCHCLKTS